MQKLNEPRWPVGIHTLFTTRAGGVSQAPYHSFNIAMHVEDDTEHVKENRNRLRAHLPSEPLWLSQVHSNRCIKTDGVLGDHEADAITTEHVGVVLAVMVADCVPILLAKKDGSRIAAVHAGWRGLADGVLAETLKGRNGDWLAWLGPAIGPCHYEVGPELIEQFDDAGAFQKRNGSWFMDLHGEARRQLGSLGIEDVSSDPGCTYCDEEKYFSYRRDGLTGRMVALIWKG